MSDVNNIKPNKRTFTNHYLEEKMLEFEMLCYEKKQNFYCQYQHILERKLQNKAKLEYERYNIDRNKDFKLLNAYNRRRTEIAQIFIASSLNKDIEIIEQLIEEMSKKLQNLQKGIFENTKKAS